MSIKDNNSCIRLSIAFPVRSLWISKTSLICSRIVSTGFSAFKALCITIDICFQRYCNTSVFEIERISLLLIITLPPVITAGGGRVRSTACTTVLFPLPDSPTKPKISPCWISKETSFTAFTGLPGVI